MAEYIDIDQPLIFKDIHNRDVTGTIRTILKANHTELVLADVVPVVRCRDCKWCHAGFCEKFDDIIPFGCANRPWEEWFCADGEKMGGEA